jgi:hypothetical protein
MRGGQNFADLTGQRFGKLHIAGRSTDYVYKDGRKRVRWVCLCDCGNVKHILGSAIKRGQTKSCGCLHKQQLSKRTWRAYEEISGVYWSRLQTDAKKRTLIWDISPAYAWDVFISQQRKCALTNVPLQFERNFKKHGSKNQTASLDRKDNQIGYVEGNVQWVHKIVNVIKWDWDIDELYRWCELLLKNKLFYTRNE